MYQLCFYVPESHGEVVKEAVFAAGAGRIGNYEACCWETPGLGQFRPLAGSRPFVGTQGAVERVRELRVEMLCEADRIDAAIAALRESHPYEEPAFHYWRVETS